MADMRLVAARHPERIPHGTANGRRNYGCTCGPCKLAHNRYQRDYRRLRRRLSEVNRRLT